MCPAGQLRNGRCIEAPQCYEAAMKLDRGGSVLAALLVMGCGSCATTPVLRAPTTPVVSMTTLMAVELGNPQGAPKVGKSYRSGSPVLENGKGAVSHPRVDRRPSGGFSGYK